MANFDLVLRGGMVFDGCGGAGQEADIAVKNGRIAAIGQVTGVGAEEIDARGHIVTPGFVDVHTHYDGQATWDARLTPSSWHGVTTVVMGNCGVGFAPCRPADHQRLMRLMEGVEDIPEPVLMEGLPWNWESFPDYLDALDARPHDIDFAAQLAHGPLRVYVMGERGANRDPATAEDVARMAALAREAVEAGALGFSTSRTINHVTSEGKPTPTLDAAREELIGIAAGLKAAGKGVLQLISDFRDPDYELALLRDMAASSGRPLSFSLAQFDTAPNMWRDLLGALDGWAAEGLDIRGQVCGRAVGVVFGLDLSAHPLLGYPSYRAIEGLPLDRRLAALRDPAFRKRILSETADGLPPLLEKVVARFDKMFPLGDPPDYEPKGECSISALARARGQSPLETALDLMLERDGKAQLYLPFLNYSDMSLDPSYEMMRHPRTILGLGDAGAHVSQICDASFSTYMLTHWTRDRVRGPKLPLEWVVRAHTKDTAEAMGLFDRGVLRPGYKADLNVIDYDRLHLHAPEVVYDLPNGGRRLIQQADGYEATIVSGTVIRRGGRPTDALPGRLIRGSQAAPG